MLYPSLSREVLRDRDGLPTEGNATEYVPIPDDTDSWHVYALQVDEQGFGWRVGAGLAVFHCLLVHPTGPINVPNTN